MGISTPLILNFEKSFRRSIGFQNNNYGWVSIQRQACVMEQKIDQFRFVEISEIVTCLQIFLAIENNV